MSSYCSYAVAVLILGSSLSYAQQERYEYRLEASHDQDLCVHMTHVFNRSFRTPWDKGYKPWMPNPTIFGKPYEQVFERLPGVDYSMDFTWRMLLSKYPSSPEFDAVPWKEGRLYATEGKPPPYQRPYPMLVAEIDIDNDDRKDWVVKDGFIQKMTTSEGWDQAYGGEDSMTIFPGDGFDPTQKLIFEQLYQEQVPSKPPRLVGRHINRPYDTMELRPFIYQGKVFVAAYQTLWRKRDRSKQKYPRLYPDLEYMNIVRVLPGGKRLDFGIIDTANTEIVCRIRMLMLNNTTPTKGN